VRGRGDEEPAQHRGRVDQHQSAPAPESVQQWAHQQTARRHPEGTQGGYGNGGGG
jgi:hypothetical protein